MFVALLVNSHEEVIYFGKEAWETSEVAHLARHIASETLMINVQFFPLVSLYKICTYVTINMTI